MMTPETIARLNAINRDFYATTAPEFSATRGRAWQGWVDALTHLPERPLHVLDVGCGNGRWALHLAEHNRLATYHGVDNNPTLLSHAQQALTEQIDVPFTLTQHDAIIDAGASLAQVTQGTTYDVVGLFGVIHHVPDRSHRRSFVQALAQHVAVGGFLIVASWRFMEFERFRARVVPWATYDAEHNTTLAQDTEENDVLLDWRRGERALRYCHYVDDEEHEALCRVTGLTTIVDYRADGSTHNLNRYTILRR